jgi:hypothetical protein
MLSTHLAAEFFLFRVGTTTDTSGVFEMCYPIVGESLFSTTQFVVIVL